LSYITKVCLGFSLDEWAPLTHNHYNMSKTPGGQGSACQCVSLCPSRQRKILASNLAVSCLVARARLASAYPYFLLDRGRYWLRTWLCPAWWPGLGLPVHILISFSTEEDILYCIGFEPAGWVLPGGVEPCEIY
jgi:hypothetical protein